MLTHPTIDQLQQLGLAEMAKAFLELEASLLERHTCRLVQRTQVLPGAGRLGLGASHPIGTRLQRGRAGVLAGQIEELARTC